MTLACSSGFNVGRLYNQAEIELFIGGQNTCSYILEG
jgi:hypothetical protein